MNIHEMRREEAEVCRWIGFGIGKGVTSPSRKISVFGVPDEPRSGLHGKLIQGFSGVDSCPLCYEDSSEKGFADFVRWVFFADPTLKRDFLGIDFSLGMSDHSGVATSFQAIWGVVRVLVCHGLSEDVEVVTLNSRMCESESLREVRRLAGLLKVSDWMVKGNSLFGVKSKFCPKCGQMTLDRTPSEFCFQCGSRISSFYPP